MLGTRLGNTIHTRPGVCGQKAPPSTEKPAGVVITHVRESILANGHISLIIPEQRMISN